MIEEHEQIVLNVAVPAEGLEAGDMGTVLHVYSDGLAYEVEFNTLDGKTAAVVTLEAAQVRPVGTQTDSWIWDKAHGRLIDNVLSQNYVPNEGTPAFFRLDGRKIELPAYVPYVGRGYFRQSPRLLCYAINQNLSKHASWTNDYTSQWGKDANVAIDRLNRSVTQGMALPIKPYAEGFIPLVAAMVLACECRRSQTDPPVLVDDVISATNFVKFSTSEDASSASTPASWWSECASRYVTEEILVLKPDIIIAFGKRTAQELNRVLSHMGLEKPQLRLLPCRFPTRIPSVRARALKASEACLWETHILPLAQRLRLPPVGACHKWRMFNFPGYFVDIAQSLGMDFG